GFTFEVVADEATGTYLFQYASMGDGSGASGNAGSGAVSGLQADTTTALQYSYFAPTLTPGKAVLWTPQQAGDAASTSAVAHVDIGAAALALPVPELDAQAAVGIRVTQPLPIGNDGNRVLNWSAGEYPAALRLPRRALAAPSADAFAALGEHRAPPAAAGSVHAGATPRGAPALPAYAVQLDGSSGEQDFIGLDLLAPDPGAAHVVVADLDGQGMDIAGGDFVDDDFSREWMLDYYWDQLYSLDTTTGEKTLVGWATPQDVGSEQWWGASWDPATGAFYAVTNTSDGRAFLYTIDLATAVATQVGPIDLGLATTVADVAIDRNGQMYGLDTLNDALLAIDKSSGAASVVGPLGVDAKYAQSIAFDRATGTLYWTSYTADGAGAVAKIDPTTGTPTPVAPSGEYRQIFALAIAKAGGDCAEPLDAPWLTLETTAGSEQPGADYGIYQVDFDATALAAGDYAATICVFSNDPRYRTHPAEIPVHFHVAPADDLDAIFADGFDG
ncbi:MAG TPA: hypothetical protein VGC30_13270, partial [Dokdonella sp.]